MIRAGRRPGAGVALGIWIWAACAVPVSAGREIPPAGPAAVQPARNGAGENGGPAADLTEAKAESAGRTAAQWLKHAGRAVGGFFRGLGQGLHETEP